MQVEEGREEGRTGAGLAERLAAGGVAPAGVGGGAGSVGRSGLSIRLVTGAVGGIFWGHLCAGGNKALLRVEWGRVLGAEV